MNSRLNKKPISFLSSLLLATGTLYSAASFSGNLDIADAPLYLGDLVKPNIMFTMDDSGSMYWAYMPSSIRNEENDERGLAYNWNKIHYNPYIEYPLPVDQDGNELAASSFTAAWDDGFRNYVGQATCTINLSNSYRASWKGDYGESGDGDYCDSTPDEDAMHDYGDNKQAAFYYVFYDYHPDSTKRGKPSGCDGLTDFNDDDCYKKVVVGTDDAVNGVTSAEAKQNFANWYSYYRLRKHLAKAGIGRAFAEQGTGIRVGYGAINQSSHTLDGVSTQTVTRGIRDFEDKTGQTYRTEFFNLLYGEDSDGSTPLRRAADDVGEYFERTDSKGPWSVTPGVSGGSDYKCQQSFHIIMSDGYWNSTGASGDANDDNDSTDGPVITGPAGIDDYQFKANTEPFDDNRSNTLADVAMYYWKRDLRTDLDNEVPFNNVDPAFWQHLVTFTVGLGLVGGVDPDTAFNAINTGTNISWPNPNDSEDEDRVDDMLHAAVNSRGGFFTADNPLDFAAGLKSAINEIQGRVGSSASVVLNSNALYNNNGTKLYQARFNSGDWTGQLLSFPINSNGSLGAQSWDASDNIPAADSRLILTYDDDASTPSGQPFRWGNLTSAQKLLLDPTDCNTNTPGDACDGENIVEFIRGKTGHSSYRIRASLLGDLVNSAPSYVGPPNFPYPDDWGKDAGVEAPENSVTYSSYKNSSASVNKTPMIFAGANDGMLHAIDANTGIEKWAFVPNAVFPNLKDLVEKDYSHKYFVDGNITVVDAFYSGAWHAVLAGSLRAGGQGIFALDVTTLPAAGDNESNITNKVLWEFTDQDDADMGYTYSQPNIVRMQNGKWAAVFGNGYNNTISDSSASTTGNAVLYIVDISDGSLIKKIDTGVGKSADPLGTNRPNGLSTVVPIDIDNDYVVDYIYGGDLFGNLWKFQVNHNSNLSNWKVAYGRPLFSAETAASGGNAQPITSRPQVIRHPYEKGQIILFGTGKYFEVGDNSSSSQDNQTFYAIWDRNTLTSSMVFTRAHLLQQTIEEEVTDTGYEYRIVSDNTMKWFRYDGNDDNVPDGKPASASEGYLGWYLDLVNTESGNTSNYGERQITDSIVRNDRLIFTTLVPPPPSADVCGEEGSGWLMELDPFSGGPLPNPPFDVDHNQIFNDQDYVTGTSGNGGTTPVIPGGIKSKVGFIPTPAILSDPGGGKEYKYTSGSTGAVEVTTENPGPGEFSRQSWRQLIAD